MDGLNEALNDDASNRFDFASFFFHVVSILIVDREKDVSLNGYELLFDDVYSFIFSNAGSSTFLNSMISYNFANKKVN